MKDFCTKRKAFEEIMREIIIRNEADTKAFGYELAKSLKPGTVNKMYIDKSALLRFRHTR